MNNLLRQFSQLLNEEGLLYGELLEALKTEKDALLKSDVNRFGRSLEVKQKLLRRLRHLENERSGLQDGLAERLGFVAHSFTLKRLAASLNAPLDARFAQQRTSLKTLLTRVRNLQQTNRTLVAHGLKLTRSSLRFLEESLAPHRVYHPSGRLQKTMGTGRLLSGNV